MCKVLKVNRSAYYHWVNRGCIVNKVDEELNQLIEEIFMAYREVYGTRRIKAVLLQEQMKSMWETLLTAVVIDLFSRKIVGWSMDDNMETFPVNNALKMALYTQKPSAQLIWHTDRGSQYTSDTHRKLLKEYGILQSMSRKGDCWDNAVSESFFHY